MNFNLVISPLAQQDLQTIVLYTKQQWGEAKAKVYLSDIKLRFYDLIEQPQIGLNRDALFKNLSSITVNRHVIFYRIDNSAIQIVRVLHQRQDPQTQLS
jgi:toxin ParE1/3/4